jgi:D-specific alpha-keto acid dehydrogenase
MICTEPSPCARDGLVPLSTGLTVFGCTRDEAAAFRVLAPRFGLPLTLTGSAPTEETVELAHGDRCVSVSHRTPVSHATLRALHRSGVTYLSSRSVGTDHIDAEYAAGLGITVEGVPYSPDSVADYTVLLMLMSLRHIKTVIGRSAIHDYRLGGTRGRELRDLTVGVVGTGRIGSAVLERLRGFGCRLLVYDVRPQDGVEHVPLDELVRRSDIVTLHLPLTADTRHLLDRRRIELMRPGAVVVNTARGGLVDTDALLDGLERGQVGGAALDVLEDEEGIFYADLSRSRLPHERLLRLQAMPNVIVTPHTAYSTGHALADIVAHTLASCLDHEGKGRHG